MKTAVIYARYSSDRQTEQSIEGQLHICEDYAKKNEILIVDTYIDRAMTGTNDNREAFQKMLADSDKKEWDYVLVYKLDRFSRNKYEMAIHRKHLKDNGIKIVSVMENIPDSPEGILLESLLEGMNQYYNEELSQKTKRGMHETRLKGNFIGGIVNYGYSVVGNKVVLNEEEAPIVRQIFTDYANGKTVVDIAKDLLTRGIRNRGKIFQDHTLYVLLRREKYTGIYRINGVTYDNIYPRIVPQEIFDAVRRKAEKLKHGKHVYNINYLLRDKLVCGYCGKPVSSYTGTTQAGKIMRYYRCYVARINKTSCPNLAIRKEILEQLVIDTLISLLNNEQTISALVHSVMKIQKQKQEQQTNLRLLEKEQEKNRKAFLNLLSAIEAGVPLTDVTRERLNNLEERNNELTDLIQQEKAKQQETFTEVQIRNYLKRALQKSPEVMIDLLIDKIIVYRDKLQIYLKYSSETPPSNPTKPEKKKNPDRKAPSQGFLFMQKNVVYDKNTVYSLFPLFDTKDLRSRYYTLEILLPL